MSGCGVHGLSFVQDNRLSILQPEDRAAVHLPMKVRWSIEDFHVTGPTRNAVQGAGYFGVFVDRAPQAPGKSVASLAAGDAACKVNPDCPNKSYFASRGIYTTAKTHVTIDFLPDRTEDDSRDFHEVTVVLLNGKGERIGESAFGVEFEVARKDGD